MALTILLNYRRGDTAGNAGRLYSALASHFGDDNVFMDIDKIDPGLNFVDVIKDWVGRCDVFIAMIGQQWLDSAYKSGQRRLDDPNDFVRMEIESALARPDVRVIPVLVQDVDMPSAEELPETMRALALRNGLEIRDVSWDYDVGRLIEALEKIEGPQPTAPDDLGEVAPSSPSRRRFDRARAAPIAAVVALVLIAAIVGFLLLRDGDDAPPPDGGGGDAKLEGLVYAGGGRLFVLDAEGSSIALKGGRDHQPEWSPDGSRIAVARAEDIVIVDREGNELQHLTSGELEDDAPSWSPDGLLVAFDREESSDSSRTDVFVVDVNQKLRNLTPEPGRTGGQPDWSPDGEFIVFQRRGALFVMRADGTGEERIRLDVGGAVHEPAWSPDRREIAIAIDHDPTDIFLFSVEEETSRNLTNGRVENPRFPSWSPDSTELAFAASDGIYRIKREGTGLTRVIEGERLEAPTWRK